MKNLKASLLAVCTLSVLSTSCLKSEATFKEKPKKKNQISLDSSNKNQSINEQIGDAQNQLQVISRTAFNVLRNSGSILSVNSSPAKKILESLPSSKLVAESIAKEASIENQSESLLLGLPIGLIGQQSIFGGVITNVTDKTSETLGGLKLTDLSPLHVKTMITMPNGSPAVSLIGCADNCDEEADPTGLINFPIVGVDAEKGLLVLDLAAMGKELDLITMLDPTGEYTKLRPVASNTTTFEYDLSTLVFDIKTKMIPVTTKPEDEATAPVTEFSVRWYLKLNSAFNPGFISRVPAPGVGFFKTERAKEPKITRFSTTDYGQTIKYYIKNVPKEWQPVFTGAIDNWNKEFKQLIGRELLSYEILNPEDAKTADIIPGDIRYNVIEWDLNNKASYGGLGPSIANQYTGETLSANVLIQGPTIIELYTKWFALSQQVRTLQAQGQIAAANKLVAEFTKKAEKEIEARSQKKFALKLGKNLELTVHTQRTDLEDPMIKNHFEIVPAGITFEQYMKGYFTEMLEHELGHNLGLRHNFKGNLGASDSGDQGSVSRSIMEYLGRPYRYLSGIGLYDKMAIAYGYRGVTPKHLNWFCTDEDQGVDKATLALASPECTKSDATSDPYSFFEHRLARAIDLLVDTKSNSAPVWKLSEITAQADEAIIGLANYGTSAEATASTWTNFFGKMNRPENAADVKEYVLNSFKKQLCNPELATIIAAKESPEAQALAQANLKDLKKRIEDKTTDWGLFTADQLKCE